MGNNSAIKVLAFDIFGTVVDWYGSIYRSVEQQVPEVDPNAFTLAWRDGYAPALAAANASGEWVILDVLHRRILDQILSELGHGGLDEATRQSLNETWHRLDAWPDSVAGIHRLKKHYTACTLSNGNLGLLANMAKNAGIHWDCILSAEVFRRYKPDPATYLGVARVFNVAPENVMLVAAHQNDLDAASASGLSTAFIERPDEFGPVRGNDVTGSESNDWHASDIMNLADQLGC